jgi:hypothetical protein
VNTKLDKLLSKISAAFASDKKLVVFALLATLVALCSLFAT